MAYDMEVARTAYQVAQQQGASPKVMLALFEAAIVESGFRNLNYGADDSVGYLQQRPSQGWPSPMDVPTATRSFVNKAKPIEGKYATAGQLAQGVQRSAFPDKYDKVANQASGLLKEIGANFPVGPTIPSNDPNLSTGLTGAVEKIAGHMRELANSAASAAKVADLGLKLALPTNMVRGAAGVFGIVFIFVGIALLGREIR